MSSPPFFCPTHFTFGCFYKKRKCLLHIHFITTQTYTLFLLLSFSQHSKAPKHTIFHSITYFPIHLVQLAYIHFQQRLLLIPTQPKISYFHLSSIILHAKFFKYTFIFNYITLPFFIHKNSCPSFSLFNIIHAQTYVIHFLTFCFLLDLFIQSKHLKTALFINTYL